MQMVAAQVFVLSQTGDIGDSCEKRLTCSIYTDQMYSNVEFLNISQSSGL